MAKKIPPRNLYPSECARCVERPGTDWHFLKTDWGRYMPHLPFFQAGMFWPVCPECKRDLKRYAIIQPILLWSVVVLTGLVWGMINVLSGHRLGFLIGFELGAGIGFVLGLIAVEIFQSRAHNYFVRRPFTGKRFRFVSPAYRKSFMAHERARVLSFLPD